MRRLASLLALAGAVAAAPMGLAAQVSAAAQPAPPAPELMQRSFTYLSHDLRVTVAGEAAGSIQVVRGEPGRLDVTARSLGGLATAGLAPGTRDELTLASSGATRVDYVLVVPGDARVTIRLPGQPGATLSSLARTGRWTWPAQPAQAEPLPTR